MKRITFWALSTLSAVVLLFTYSTSTSGPGAPSVPLQADTVVSSTLPTGASAPAGSSGSGTPQRTVTGSVAATRWGPVQVELVVRGDSILKASVVQHPSGNSKDAQINGRALPILTKETIDAQNANIDMVSGATVTSTGYLSSLQSALDQVQSR